MLKKNYYFVAVWRKGCWLSVGIAERGYSLESTNSIILFDISLPYNLLLDWLFAQPDHC